VLRDREGAAWTYHQHSMRWLFNTLGRETDVWAEATFKEHPEAPMLRLPRAKMPATPLGDAMARRITCRSFSEVPLAVDDLSTVLHAAYGVGDTVHFGSREHLERPVPSGGGLYPLEVYVIAQRVSGIEAGIYHYVPLHHALEQLRRVAFTPAYIAELFMNQPYLADAAAIVVFTAVTDRTMHKYEDRGYRYILFECGHAAQNICLTTAALGLGVLPVGGFFDAYLAETLRVDLAEEVLLYALGVGPSSVPPTERVGHRNIGVVSGG
jgi:SagB-type dehydrogenase family enzyme